MTTLPTVADLDVATAATATTWLRPCCASMRWAVDLLGGRPYGDLAALSSRSDQVIAALDAVDLDEAVAAHPRIGERAAGTDTESGWSRQEQSATADLAATVQQQLIAVNLAYERRFGQVFLICATGRSAEQMLDDARRRLSNTPSAEREVVRAELAAIVRLRLAKAFGAASG